MNFTANLSEIVSCVNGQIADPHHILGLHEVEIEGKTRLFARAYIPQAESIFVSDPKTGEKWELSRIHSEGFFEGEITDRKNWFRYIMDIEFDDGSNYQTHDPYSFEPHITELDLYLFGQGTHYKIFDKLGAHFVEIDGVCGVVFAVWAPNAARVSVIGNFNNYDGRRHQMRLLEQSGIWELFIPNLIQYDRYKFEIRTTNGVILQKSDPYANFSQLRPSTNSLLFDISKYKWNDDDWMLSRKSNHPLNGALNIYEVSLSSWKKGESNRFLSY
ncbi:MAG: 1,4-alpha-glucan branching enzyme, partial [Defluviitaleaceae bacterium]|nr:1,4-alpha-glucan branching enzyme [Defluviitaleaceae bacterium]